MTTQKVFSSRALKVDADTYVGEAGRLFYAQPAGTGIAPVLKYSDGSTPGGISITGASSGAVTSATVSMMIANSLTNYATKVYVTSQGFITSNIFTTTNVSTFVNDAHYIQNETAVNSVVGTVNQVIVTDLGGRNIQLSTPQNLNSTATVRFGDLTVNNISILGTSTNLVSDVVQGYRLYLASSATNLSQINGGGVQLGNTATGVHSIFWNAGGYWDTDGDGIKTLNLEATTSTLATLKVLNQARFGYVNHDLTLANAYIQVDSDSNNFSQIAIINHNTGTNASADIVATNDTGNDSTGFIDMGINSSVFSTSSWTVNGANDGYLYVAGGGLAIGTDQVGGEIKTFLGPLDTPTVISRATATTITYSVDLMPSVDAQYQLGKPGQRWKGIYVGTGSVWIQDIGLGTDAELTVVNGILFINGISGLRVGNIQITPTGLTTDIGSQNITIGEPGDTGYVETYRGIQYSNGSRQTVAWNSTATVQWSQITGTPAIGVTSITTGTGIRVDHSTGTVNISFANDGGYITSAALSSYATQTYVNSQGFITSSALSPYTPTSGLGTIIANSLTNYATQTYVNSQGFITSSALSPYTPTSGLGTIIANSLTNYATQTYVTTRGYITSSSLSVTTGSAVSGGALAYSTTTGVFTFNPATAYSLTTATNSALGGVKIGSGINAAGDGTISVTAFNTGTLVAHAVLADTAFTATNAGYAYSFNTGTLVTQAVSATTSTNASTAYVTIGTHSTGTGILGSSFNGSTNITWSLNTSTLMANAVSATTATNAGYAYSFNTGTLVANAVNAQVATTSTNAAYAYSFNTGTLVTTAVTANSVAGGWVSSITAGTGTAVSTSTGAVTVWAVAQAITSTGSTTASNYTIDLSGPTFVHWQPSANGSRTITLTGFTPGRKIEVFITPHATNDVFTVSGVTASQCSNGVNTFTMQGVGASTQASFMLQIYCTTNAIGGVWIYGNGSL